MAVYTQLTREQVQEIIGRYDVGALQSFEGILEGVENSNFKVETDQGKFILTIFEKRVDPNELPFFFDFMAHLSEQGIACPSALPDQKGERIQNIDGKAAALISFLDGHNLHTSDVTKNQCYEMGILTARMHMAAAGFSETRRNSVSLPMWKDLFSSVQDEIDEDLYDLIASELFFLEQNFDGNWPLGIVHADLFPDNVFVIDGKVQGVIDFYFSCEDYLAYDLALVANAWCFDENGEIIQARFKNLIDGYETVRPLTSDEKKNFSTISRAAALRILMTRLHDWVFQDPEALVKPKDPHDYIQILQYHRERDVFE